MLSYSWFRYNNQKNSGTNAGYPSQKPSEISFVYVNFIRNSFEVHYWVSSWFFIWGYNKFYPKTGIFVGGENYSGKLLWILVPSFDLKQFAEFDLRNPIFVALNMVSKSISGYVGVMWGSGAYSHPLQNFTSIGKSVKFNF